jgi:hypothetical protein
MNDAASPSSDGPAAHPVARVTIVQRRAVATSGWLGLIVLGAAIYGQIVAHGDDSSWFWLPFALSILVLTGLDIIAPGEMLVVEFFGRYIGTVTFPGFWLVAPFHQLRRRRISVRVRNFETAHLKVNDADGNPVEIAAIVVWQVVDTAKATYAVENYQNFVTVQAESALRHVATGHPYDDTTGVGTSLRGSTDVVAAQLAREVAERVLVAGIEIVEVRISHLAYAQEIAQAMLRRQQANAVVAARSRIVEGAVGMVDMALNRLSEGGVVSLDEERTASMVSNLMVVLCGDQPPSPVVNTGSLYT